MTRPAINWTYRATVLALCLATSASADTVATLIGIATRARDGDGILFGQVEVRLRAVAAPEDRRGAPRTLEGRTATAALDALVRGEDVTCHLDGTVASSGRPVGTCFVDGQDVGALMVLRGLALACAAYGDDYADEEAAAVAAGLDLAARYERPRYCLED